MKTLPTKTLLPMTLVTAIAATSGITHAAPGYMDNKKLPTFFSQTIVAAEHGVIANDKKDDAPALQAIIDSIDINNDPSNLIRIKLPSGEITLNEEIHVDRSGIVIEGQGTTGAEGTSVVVNSWSPYGIDEEGAPAFDKKYWPGFGAFRVETRKMHPKEPNYEGSINFHWKHGIEPGQPYSKGDTSIIIEKGGAKKFKVGDLIYVGATSDTDFLNSAGVPAEKQGLKSITGTHMRHDIMTVVDVDVATETVTLDRPLDFGAELVSATGYKSRVMPITPVENVGFRDFSLTMNQASTQCAGYNTNEFSYSNPKGATLRYENLCPEDALHGIIFKFAKDSFVDNVKIEWMGSHPVVTEFGKNLTLQNMVIDGAWNKGAGGNGYFRGSKLHDSVIRNNHIQDVRHLSLQWSASGNIVEDNSLINADINLHGGWERHNIIRNNSVTLAFEHRSWSDGKPGEGSWQPVWFSSGNQAADWAGPTGPNNMLINNKFEKSQGKGKPIVRWGLFDEPGVAYILGGDADKAVHPSVDGELIPKWDYDIAKKVFEQMPQSGVKAIK